MRQGGGDHNIKEGDGMNFLIISVAYLLDRVCKLLQFI